MIRLDDIYVQADISPASDDFWRAVDKIDETLSDDLKPRPISTIAIQDACSRAEKSFRVALGVEKRARAAATKGGTGAG